MSCAPLTSYDDLARRIESAYRRRLEAVAYAPDPTAEDGRRILGRVEKPLQGPWLYCCETAET